MPGFRTVRVPASSANLGPGFDALALAVAIYLECRYRRSDALAIRAQGRDADLISTGEDNLIWQTALKVAADTAGMAAAIDSNGKARAVRLELDPHYGVAIVVPDFLLPTEKARRVLPYYYSREDAIFNVQRSALLIVALATGVTDAFSTAFEDRLHQPYRAPLVPGLQQITRLRAPGLLGCALSGAGPSILVFYERGHENVCELVRESFAAHGHASEVVWTQLAPRGYDLC